MKSLEDMQESLEASMKLAYKNYRKAIAADKSDDIIKGFHRNYLIRLAEVHGFTAAYTIMLGDCNVER